MAAMPGLRKIFSAVAAVAFLTLLAACQPEGSLEAATVTFSPGRASVTVSGWAYDRDAPRAAVDVHVYVSGGFAGSATANLTRWDVAATYPDAGPDHGYTLTVAAQPGDHDVCVFAINAPGTAGTNTLVECRRLSVPAGPFGALDVVDDWSALDGSVTFSGWAIDPRTTAPIPVHVYVGARGTATVANTSRPDVAAAYPAYGDRHGYQVSVPYGEGVACAYAIDTITGGTRHRQLGCVDLEARWRAQLLTEVNNTRAYLGRSRVVMCPALDRGAESYATTLATHRQLSHTGPDGSTFAQRLTAAGYTGAGVRAGENLGMGQRDAASVVAGWMASPGHRDNLLSASWTHMGIGRDVGLHPTYPQTVKYWTQWFGASGRC
jgi:uncharacterized protein YkwD